MNSNINISKKIAISVVEIIVLTVCLCITTFALVWEVVAVDNSFFHTGMVKINLNDNKPIIEEHEFLFAPGMTVKKDFFIENESTMDVYYKLYFDDIEGGLAEVLDVAINDGDKIIYKGKAKELTASNVTAVNDILRLNERKELTAYFHFPEEAGNETQNLVLAFSMKADAVQTKNNPDKKFE